MNRLGAWSLKRVGGLLISLIGLVVGSRTRHHGVLGSIPATARDKTPVLDKEYFTFGRPHLTPISFSEIDLQRHGLSASRMGHWCQQSCLHS